MSADGHELFIGQELQSGLLFFNFAVQIFLAKASQKLIRINYSQ